MTVYIVDLESVESRYTCEWKWHLPELIEGSVPIEGAEDIPKATTPGAFLNFGGTNIYKAKQIETMGRMFCDGTVKAGDHFLFTDAWHPGIISLKYMSELLNLPVIIHSLWHAGSYDKFDFLGRLIKDKTWTYNFERSLFYASDYNYFATNFHIKLFVKNILQRTIIITPHQKYDDNKIVRTGWPMEYLKDSKKTTLLGTTDLQYSNNSLYYSGPSKLIETHKSNLKENLIVFPHRIAPEKQPKIFKDLAQSMPEYEFVMCQEKQLTKAEYHAIIRRAKIIFSANLQETLGISPYEGALVGAIPMVPDRLSYSEMYSADFKYNSTWTLNFDNYLKHKEKLINLIKHRMDNYTSFYPSVVEEADKLSEEYFSCTPLLQKLNT